MAGSAGLALRVAAAAAVLAAAGGAVPADPADPPIRFRDLTVLSGGSVDFGSPTSTVEKATGAFVDVDGDGWDDVVTLTGVGQPFGLHLNRPDGAWGRTFVPAPAGHGLDEGPAFERDGASVAAGDVDNDGDEDLFVGCGFDTGLASGENLLLLNDGTGRFTDRALEAGLQDGNNTTAACVLFDMDLDGDLDLLTANSNLSNFGKVGNGKVRLFRNLLRETGSLLFADETADRITTTPSVGAWAMLAPDQDGDGSPDILITRDMQYPTQLYRNDGSGRFTDVSAAVGAGVGDDEDPSTFGNDSRNGMGVCSGDADNDGYLDYYITNIQKNPLYLGGPGGTLTEKGETAGVRAGFVTWGCLFADFDLDGFVDLHVTGGDTYGLSRDLIRSFLYRNRGDGTFEEVFEGSGLRWDFPLHREMGSALSDFDGDGRPDLLVVRAEREPAPPYLYRNETDTAGRHWVAVEVRGNGITSNRSAIGATVRVWPRDALGERIPGPPRVAEVYGSVSRSGRSGLSTPFGLGADAVTVDVEVTWPRAGPLEDRRDLFVRRPVDGRLVFNDDPGPRAELVPLAEAVVRGGRPAWVPVPGGGGAGVPLEVDLEDGPAWAGAARDEEGAWGIAVDPPLLDRDLVVPISVLGVDTLHNGLASRQAMTLTVAAPPAVDAVRPRRRGRVLVVDGRNLAPGRCSVQVDGIAAKKVRFRRRHREEDGDASRMRVRVPFRGAARRGAHELEVYDPRTGYLSDAAAYRVE